MALDLGAISAELTATKAVVDLRLGGHENLIRNDLTRPTDEAVKKMQADYKKWSAVLARLVADFGTLGQLGYPTLPTLVVPPDVKKNLVAERSQTDAAEGCFVLEGAATAINADFKITDQAQARAPGQP